MERLPLAADTSEKLHEVLVIAVCGLLAGGESFYDMEDFAFEREPWLSTVKLETGMGRTADPADSRIGECSTPPSPSSSSSSPDMKEGEGDGEGDGDSLRGACAGGWDLPAGALRLEALRRILNPRQP